MKRILLTATALTMAASAQADAGFMIGISHNFGGSTGVTFKILSTHEKDKALVAAGVTYFPWNPAKPWGVDTSVGYSFNHGAVTVGYDWLSEQVQLSLGAANTKDRSTPAPAASPALPTLPTIPTPPAPPGGPTV